MKISATSVEAENCIGRRLMLFLRNEGRSSGFVLSFIVRYVGDLKSGQNDFPLGSITK